MLCDIYGVEQPEKFITFEEQVKLDHTSFIDGYIDVTHVMIEQKSFGKNLPKEYYRLQFLVDTRNDNIEYVMNRVKTVYGIKTAKHELYTYITTFIRKQKVHFFRLYERRHDLMT